MGLEESEEQRGGRQDLGYHISYEEEVFKKIVRNG